MNIRILFLLSVFVFFAQCRSKRTDKNTPPAVAKPVVNEPSIMLDTVQVLADKPVEQKTYRGSVTRTNDILHTRLEVNFDWTNSRLNGKAALTVKPHFYPVSKLFLDARGMEIKSVEVFELKAAEPKPKQATTSTRTDQTGIKVSGSSYVYENDSLKIELG